MEPRALSPLAECRDRVRRALAARGLDRMAAAAEMAVEPCLRIVGSETADGDLAVGTSKIGGAPDVPMEFAWPEHQGMPLAFLAQFDLAEVATKIGPTDLPAEGLLSFFYEAEEQPWGGDQGDEGSWRVVWTPAGRRLARRDLPVPTLPVLGLRFVLAPSLPGWDLLPIDDLNLSEPERDGYYAVLEELGPERPEHQLLGHAGEIQNDPRWACEADASGLSGVRFAGDNQARIQQIQGGLEDWHLLFQLDTDDRATMVWGDAGMLYFMVRRDDLRRRAFDRVRMTLQCY